ncbi:hypothetical protein SDC9_205603 [bioreactor metagenome]|uniref:Uncharacterized protein n=1 Tax=bioreactor metagenome TaxID=1076179 RepID=A0A645J3D0_9ZZZZ
MQKALDFQQKFLGLGQLRAHVNSGGGIPQVRPRGAQTQRRHNPALSPAGLHVPDPPPGVGITAPVVVTTEIERPEPGAVEIIVYAGFHLDAGQKGCQPVFGLLPRRVPGNRNRLVQPDKGKVGGV